MRRLVLGALLLGASACGAASRAHDAAAAIRITSSVSLTRSDGSPVAVKQHVRVWCGRWARDVRTPAIHVRIGDPRGPAVWRLSAVVADVRRRPVVRFPHSFVWNKPSRALIGGHDDRNEFTTAEEESSGRVVFSRVRCGRRLDVRFRVDAVMGSEFSDGTPVAIRGAFGART